MIEMLTLEEKKKLIRRRLYRHGSVQVALGLLSLAFSLFAVIQVEVFVGSILLMNGVSTAWYVFYAFREGDSPWQGTLMAVVALAAGLVFLFHPISNVIIMSFFLSTYFLVGGLMRVTEGLRIRTIRGWYWILISGLISIIFSLALFGGVSAARPMLKIMFAVNMISWGCGFIAVASSN